STHFFSRFFFLTTRSPPLFTLFPYTTLFRSVFLLSGLIGGFAGGLQILGVNYRFIDHFSPGYGFTGIAVALLGRGHPAGILLSALFFGALSNGGAMIQLFSDIPLDLINILQGVVMIFAVIELSRLPFVRRWLQRA